MKNSTWRIASWVALISAVLLFTQLSGMRAWQFLLPGGSRQMTLEQATAIHAARSKMLAVFALLVTSRICSWIARRQQTSPS
jgi:hypothetical protein